MSYVLTEIALEMLGYKFYDINGDAKKLSFQDNQKADDDEHAGDPSLVDVVALEDKPNGVDLQQPTSSSSPIIVDVSDNLNVLFEKEYVKLCKEVAQSHVEHLKAHSQEIVDMEKRPESNLQLYISNYIDGEKQNLDQEMIMIEKFRQTVENHLVRLDQRLFKDYAKALKSNIAVDSKRVPNNAMHK